MLPIKTMLGLRGMLRLMQQTVADREPGSMETGVLLRKPDKAPSDIADEFVVGYGQNYDGRYRSLPYVAVLSLTTRGSAAGECV